MLEPTVIISVLALIVSMASVLIAGRAGRRQNELQERLVTLETARERDRLRVARSAQLVASIVRPVKSTVWLAIVNNGNATARNIRLRLDGKPVLEHPLVLRGDEEITTIGPGADARYILAVMLGTPSLLVVRIEWEDDSQELGIWESQLKLR